MTEYTKSKISNQLGIPLRTIQFWSDLGIIYPEIKAPLGKGRIKIYSASNLIEFAMIDVMLRYLDLTLDQIRVILFKFQFLHREHSSHTSDLTRGFEDFFTDSKWGKTTELRCIVDTYTIDNPNWNKIENGILRAEQLRDSQVNFEVVTINDKGEIEAPSEHNDLPYRIYRNWNGIKEDLIKVSTTEHWLGVIKLMAMDKFKLY